MFLSRIPIRVPIQDSFKGFLSGFLARIPLMAPLRVEGSGLRACLENHWTSEEGLRKT